MGSTIVPGLDGTLRDTCIVCYGPTDTGVTFEGEAEWHVAALIVLGVPEDEAFAIIDDMWAELPPGQVPVKPFTCSYRVCESHAATIGMAVGVIPLGTLPSYSPM